MTVESSSVTVAFHTSRSLLRDCPFTHPLLIGLRVFTGKVFVSHDDLENIGTGSSLLSYLLEGWALFLYFFTISMEKRRGGCLVLQIVIVFMPMDSEVLSRRFRKLV